MADLEARALNVSGVLDENATADRSGGEVLRSSDGRAGFVNASRGPKNGDDYALRVGPVIAEIDKDGNAINANEDVYWDASANKATPVALDLDGSSDLYLGRCVEDAAAGDDVVKVDLNQPSRYERARPFVFEFDCSTAGDTDDHTLLPGYMNPHGCVFYDAFGLVTETFGGGTEDQGIITLEDEDDNALGTITAADAGGDAAGDIVRATNTAQAASDGAAAKTVAAGKAITGRVSQQTSGSSEAGKFKVYLVVLPLE